MRLATGATVFIFFFSTIFALSEHELAVQLRQYLGSKSISLDDAVIIIIDPENQLKLRESEEDSGSYLTNSESKEFRTAVAKVDDKPDDEEAYELYNVLRSQSYDGLDSSEIEKIHKLKSALRAAFQQKCKKYKNCVQKCSGTKKVSCTIECDEQYDELSICGGSGEPATTSTTAKDWCKVEDECGPKTTPTTEDETDKPRTKKWGRKTWPPNWEMN